MQLRLLRRDHVLRAVLDERLDRLRDLADQLVPRFTILREEDRAEHPVTILVTAVRRILVDRTQTDVGLIVLAVELRQQTQPAEETELPIVLIGQRQSEEDPGLILLHWSLTRTSGRLLRVILTLRPHDRSHDGREDHEGVGT